MSELPPDAHRLREILDWLDERSEENATLVTYLRMQREAVREALARAEGSAPAGEQGTGQGREAPPQKPSVTRLPEFSRPRDQTGFKVTKRRTPDGPKLDALHLGDCNLDGGPSKPLDAHEALVALSDGLPACAICRPDAVLGFGG